MRDLHAFQARVMSGALVVLALTGSPAIAQIDALYLSDYRDGDLKIRYDQTSKESTATLPIKPTDSPVVLVFEARWKGRDRGQVPSAIEVRAYPPPRLDNPVPRPVDMRLVLGTTGSEPVTLAFFGSNWGAVGFTAPGQEMWVVRFHMTAEELAALALSGRISGDVMGLAFTFTERQVEHVREFSGLLQLPRGRF